MFVSIETLFYIVSFYAVVLSFATIVTVFSYRDEIKDLHLTIEDLNQDKDWAEVSIADLQKIINGHYTSRLSMYPTSKTFEEYFADLHSGHMADVIALPNHSFTDDEGFTFDMPFNVRDNIAYFGD